MPDYAPLFRRTTFQYALLPHTVALVLTFTVEMIVEEIINGGDVTLNVMGGVPPYTYYWDDKADQNTNSVKGLSSGAHSVSVVDAYGCSFNKSLVVILPGVFI